MSTLLYTSPNHNTSNMVVSKNFLNSFTPTKLNDSLGDFTSNDFTPKTNETLTPITPSTCNSSSMSKYVNLGTIGEGSYGLVLKCRDRQSGRIVAIKKFIESEDDKSVRKIAMREIHLLKQLRHENLVNLIEVFRRKRRLYLVFEFVDKSLLDHLELSPDGLEKGQCRRILYQVIRALEFCHIHNIIHRDVKPENILISKQGIVKLCDFGFARTLAKPGEIYTEYVSTRWYRAPELLVGDARYGRAVDIWALGCLYAEMLTGQPLFPGDSDIDQLFSIVKCFGGLCRRHEDKLYTNPMFRFEISQIEVSEPLKCRLRGCNTREFQFVSMCLELDPQDRPTCSSLLQHQLFTCDGFSSWFPEEMTRKLEDEQDLGSETPTKPRRLLPDVKKCLRLSNPPDKPQPRCGPPHPQTNAESNRKDDGRRDASDKSKDGYNPNERNSDSFETSASLCGVDLDTSLDRFSIDRRNQRSPKKSDLGDGVDCNGSDNINHKNVNHKNVNYGNVNHKNLNYGNVIHKNVKGVSNDGKKVAPQNTAWKTTHKSYGSKVPHQPSLPSSSSSSSSPSSSSSANASGSSSSPSSVSSCLATNVDRGVSNDTRSSKTSCEPAYTNQNIKPRSNGSVQKSVGTAPKYHHHHQQQQQRVPCKPVQPVQPLQQKNVLHTQSQQNQQHVDNQSPKTLQKSQHHKPQHPHKSQQNVQPKPKGRPQQVSCTTKPTSKQLQNTCNKVSKCNKMNSEFVAR